MRLLQRSLLIFMVIILSGVALTESDVCPNHPEDPQVRIQLEPSSELWTSPGTYKTVELNLYLNALENNNNDTKAVRISYFEKFPSQTNIHATFVTSMRPQSTELSPWNKTKG